jgi:glycosyltransferase involved in cell wall biosynthesis
MTEQKMANARVIPRSAQDGGQLSRRLALIGNQAFLIHNFRGPLIQDMIARGWEVLALAPDYDDDSRAAVRSLGAEPVDWVFTRTGLNPLADVLAMLRLARMLRQRRVAVTLSYFIKPVIYGTIAARLAGVQRRFALIEGLGYAFIEETAASFKRSVVRWSVKSLYRFALSLATGVFFLNKDDLADFRRWSLVSPDKGTVIGAIGLDLEDWRPAPAVTQPVVFLLVARLLRDKGVYEYVDAARRVKASHSDARFLLLGGLDSNPAAIPEEIVRSWVAEGVIEWHGHVPVRPWLAEASVFVLPSYREGVPRSTQEAMAMARPVITTDAVGCRETVVEGKNGFLVPVRDADALEAVMRRFIQDPQIIEPMGKESRRMAENLFDARRANKVILDAMGL